MNAKPIETRAFGYRFRSRLEARWATFFDALNVKWEYETEGFALNGTPYLPDFRITINKRDGEFLSYSYIEIKPIDALTGEDLQKVTAYGKHKTDHPLTVFFGDPYTNFHETPTRAPLSPQEDGTLADLGNVDALFVVGALDPEAYAYMVENGAESNDAQAACIFATSRTMLAAQKSREARFEHGEKPGAKFFPLPAAPVAAPLPKRQGINEAIEELKQNGVIENDKTMAEIFPGNINPDHELLLTITVDISGDDQVNNVAKITKHAAIRKMLNTLQDRIGKDLIEVVVIYKDKTTRTPIPRRINLTGELLGKIKDLAGENNIQVSIVD